jgi:hypothetical protein
VEHNKHRSYLDASEVFWDDAGANLAKGAIASS